jgi:ArsR family transcriptional regulator, arsenate/arsenite/antimonite-responsive transcriptional repressor
MDTDDALSILSALGHPTRLDAFRLLIRHEPDGLSTGELVQASGLTQSTFSTHLAVMVRSVVGNKSSAPTSTRCAD